MEKLFTFAGVSRLNGVVAYRFANDAGRVRVLERNGHTDIDLRELPTAMTKEAATQWVNQQGIHAEHNRVTVAKTAPAVQRKAPTAPSTVQATAQADDDGFVEPKDERIQVAMTRMAREYPGLSAQKLLDTVLLTMKPLPNN
jgi:hypothetical protein